MGLRRGQEKAQCKSIKQQEELRRELKEEVRNWWCTACNKTACMPPETKSWDHDAGKAAVRSQVVHGELRGWARNSQRDGMDTPLSKTAAAVSTLRQHQAQGYPSSALALPLACKHMLHQSEGSAQVPAATIKAELAGAPRFYAPRGTFSDMTCSGPWGRGPWGRGHGRGAKA